MDYFKKLCVSFLGKGYFESVNISWEFIKQGLAEKQEIYLEAVFN